MTSVAVIGGGGVGGLIAAAAQSAGHNTVLCVRTPFPALEIRTGEAVREVPVRIATDPEPERPADWVLVATKIQDTPSAAAWLRHLTGVGTTVVVLQNGIDHEERVRPFVGDATVLPALIYTSVERIGPGRLVHHTGSRIFIPEGAPGAAFAQLLEGSGLEIALEPDFLTASWRKLLANTAVNPITALTLRRIGVMREPKIRELAIGIFRETVAVGCAAGARLGEKDVDAMVARYETLVDSSGSSMLYDRLAGRPLEYDGLSGAVVRTAERFSIPVPLNRTMLALLEALDTGLAAGRSPPPTT
jgi:2-dehydropantoate 2-reductase